MSERLQASADSKSLCVRPCVRCHRDIEIKSEHFYWWTGPLQCEYCCAFQWCDATHQVGLRVVEFGQGFEELAEMLVALEGE